MTDQGQEPQEGEQQILEASQNNDSVQDAIEMSEFHKAANTYRRLDQELGLISIWMKTLYTITVAVFSPNGKDRAHLVDSL